jgi:hypothetical protein
MEKINGFVHFWEQLPAYERTIVDILRQIVIENIPDTYKEKFAWNVPCYYGNRQVCIIWPAAVPRGGFKEGVLLGFSQGRELQNKNGYIKSGNNKKIYYRIIKSVEEINEKEIKLLLKEAIIIDNKYKAR